MHFYIKVKVLFIVIIYLENVIAFPSSGNVETLYSWKSFLFEDLPHSQYSQADGYNYYMSESNMPTGVSLHWKTQCMFFPIVRVNPGIPATITYVSTAGYTKGSSPILRGFPTYEDNYVPGWFGVNELSDDDYLHNIYPSDYAKNIKSTNAKDETGKVASEGRQIKDDVIKEEVKESSQTDEIVNGEEKVIGDTPSEDIDKINEEQEEDDESRKKHGSHSKPSYSHHHHNKRPIVVYVPVPVTNPPTTPTTTAPTKPTSTTYKKPTKVPSRKLYHFISVFYTMMDNVCDRIFFIDYGVTRRFEETFYYRPPILWAFGINGCDQYSLNQPPELKVTIPTSVSQSATGSSYHNIDVYGDCNEFAVYIPNCYDNTIVVYDNVKRSFWYFEHETFLPGAERSLYPGPLPADDSSNIGVMGMILGKKSQNAYREVFYSPGSSYGLFKTSTKILRNKYLAPGNPTSPDFSFIGYGGQDSQSIMAYDTQTNVLFFVHLFTNRLQCWNTNKPLELGAVATLSSNLEYGTDILIDGDRNLQFLYYDGDGQPWFTHNRTQNALYQLFRVSIDVIIKGTACDPRYV